MKRKVQKNEFLAKIIHDLKTPAIALTKALDIIYENTHKQLSPEDKDLFELSINTSNYMLELIGIFNSVYKLDYEPLRLTYEKFDFIDLINEVIKEMNILLMHNRLELEFLYDGQIIFNADRLQIKRVVQNLFSNAINYSFKETKIVLKARVYKGNLYFEVKNRAPYIEPCILNEIFEKYKTHQSCFNKAGIGLGLYLSKEIILAHHGNMIAQSFDKNINVFGFCLPV